MAFNKLPFKYILLKNAIHFAQDFTHSKVNITDLGLDFSGFYLQEITIYDFKEDTLGHIGKLHLSLPEINFKKKKIYAYQCSIDTLYLNQHVDSLRNDNLLQWIDSLSSDTAEATKKSESWKFKSNRIQIGNIHFISKNDTATNTVGKFNVNDIDLYGNTDILDFFYDGTNINLVLNKLNITEKSGFQIKKLKAEFLYNPDNIEITNFELQLNKSDINFLKIEAKPNTKNNFAELAQKGSIKLFSNKKQQTKIYTSDFKYFNNKIPELDFVYSGDFQGNLNDANLQNVSIMIDTYNSLFVNAEISQFTDIKKTKFNIDNLLINSDLNILNKKLDNLLNLPVLSDTLANIHIQAKAFGSLNEADIEAQLETIFGKISLELSIDQKDDKYISKGELWSTILKSKNLPFIPYDSLQFSLDNKFTISYSKQWLTADLDGQLANMKIEDTALDSLYFQLNINNDSINFRSKSEDANLNFSFDSQVQLKKNSITGKTQFNLNRANLNALKLDTTYITKVLKINSISSSFNFTSIDTFNGNIKIDKIDYTSPDDNLFIKNININADSIGKERILSFQSDFINAKIQGKFTTSDLIKASKATLNQFMPTVFQTEKENIELLNLNRPIGLDKWDENKKLSFNVDIKNTQQLSSIFAPEYYMAPSTKIKGLYFLDFNFLKFNVKSDSVSFNGTSIKSLDFDVRTTYNKLILSASSDGINIANQVNLKQFTMDWQISKDTADFTFNWGNFAPIHNYSGEINLRLIPQRLDSASVNYKILLSPNEITLDDKDWAMENAELNISPNIFSIKNIHFHNQESSIKINGQISENLRDTLIIDVKQISLEEFDQIIGENGIHLSGNMNGSMKIINLLDIPIIYANDTISNLTINNQNIGNTFILSDYDRKTDFLKIRLKAETGIRKKTNTLLISGKYSPKTNYIQLDTISLYHLRTKTLNPFLTGYLSNPVGYINGELSLKGKLDNPEIKGEIILAKTKFTVDYLQTRFNISDTIFIQPGKIILKDFQMEQSRNTATIDGEINYTGAFNQLNFDIGLFTNKFNFLNTRQTDTSYFYGEANLSADVKIFGTPDDIQMKISGKTMPGTRFYIPLTSESDIEETAFLTFENNKNKATIQEPELYTKEVSGIEMDFTLNVTPDAEVQLIFDEKVGDIIRARGEGNIKMLINANGDLSMYGDYVVSKGDYLFTLGNTLNKKFLVDKGGLIRWNGDPYNAVINLSAIYNVKKVALYDLTYDENDKNKKIPAECLLNMTNNLEQPIIKFDIDLPTAGEDLVQQFNNLPSDELNKQILSLLIFNKFQSLPGYKQEVPKQAGVDFNTTEMLTNQLSHWLSQISNDLDIGINYQSGDSLGGSELEVELSTQLLDERLSINSNIGVSNSTQNTNNQNFVGDMEIEYKIDKNGKFKAKAFTKTNQYDIDYDQPPYSYGLGIFYRHEFDKLIPSLKRKKIKTDSLKKQ